MSVYVDSLSVVLRTDRRWPWPTSCHLFGDSAEELHNFAKEIGLRKGWFQDHDKLPHYDLTENRRKVAVAHGAIEVSHRFTYTKMKGTV